MITVHKNNIFKLTENGVATVKSVIDSGYETKLANRYRMRSNTAIKKGVSTPQIFHEFGSTADFTYGTSAGVSVKFDLEKQTMMLDCFADGGMTSLTFDETDRTTHTRNAEDQAINFTLKLIKTLTERDIISPRKSDLKTPFPDMRLVEIGRIKDQIKRCEWEDSMLVMVREDIKKKLHETNQEIADNALEKLRLLDRLQNLELEVTNNPK